MRPASSAEFSTPIHKLALVGKKCLESGSTCPKQCSYTIRSFVRCCTCMEPISSSLGNILPAGMPALYCTAL